MASDNVSAVSAFIEGAPPGEVCPPPNCYIDNPLPNTSPPQLADVVNGTPLDLIVYPNVKSFAGPHRITDIKSLTEDDPTLIERARPAFRKYNEEQLTTVKLPGSGKNVR